MKNKLIFIGILFSVFSIVQVNYVFSQGGESYNTWVVTGIVMSSSGEICYSPSHLYRGAQGMIEIPIDLVNVTASDDDGSIIMEHSGNTIDGEFVVKEPLCVGNSTYWSVASSDDPEAVLGWFMDTRQFVILGEFGRPVTTIARDSRLLFAPDFYVRPLPFPTWDGPFMPTPYGYVEELIPDERFNQYVDISTIRELRPQLLDKRYQLVNPNNVIEIATFYTPNDLASSGGFNFEAAITSSDGFSIYLPSSGEIPNSPVLFSVDGTIDTFVPFSLESSSVYPNAAIINAWNLNVEQLQENIDIGDLPEFGLIVPD